MGLGPSSSGSGALVPVQQGFGGSTQVGRLQLGVLREPLGPLGPLRGAGCPALQTALGGSGVDATDILQLFETLVFPALDLSLGEVRLPSCPPDLKSARKRTIKQTLVPAHSTAQYWRMGYVPPPRSGESVAVFGTFV